jgi:hypothetical protein
MAEPIQFRIRLTGDDWDDEARAFRCNALSIPDATPIAYRSDGRAVANAEFLLNRPAREIGYTGPGPVPADLLVTIQIKPALTTWRTAGASASVVALLTTLITGYAGYQTAVEPARINAELVQEQLKSESAACKLKLSEATAKLEKSNAPQQPTTTNTTHGHDSPINNVSGPQTINK